MPVSIHGKQYMTVAERVNDFRNKFPDYTLETQLISSDPDTVVMKALIYDNQPGDDNLGRLLATGYAEEKRGATQINRTSALENCETSAIGRALAALGFGGTEYASANEVQNAIGQQAAGQVDTKPIRQKVVERCYEMLREEVLADKEAPDYDRMKSGMEKISNDERMAVMDMFGDEKIPNPSTGRDRLLRNVVNDCLNYHPADDEAVE